MLNIQNLMKLTKLSSFIKYLKQHKNGDVHCGVWLGMVKCWKMFGKLPENCKRFLCRIIYLRLDFLKRKFFVGC